MRAIHVRDGQTVKAGDVLIELDPTMSGAEREHLQERSDRGPARRRAAARGARAATRTIRSPTSMPPAEAEPALVEMQRQLLASSGREQRAKLAALDRQVAQKEAERATIRRHDRQARRR